ncbi:MAG: 50S ribosomal protein L10 [Clostridia bacterium]
MPSKSVLESKEQAVAALKEKIGGSISGVIVDYKGINAEQDTKLRKELREAGVDYTVVKNTLLKRAIADTNYESMAEVLEGTTALAISTDDVIAPAKILSEYAKSSNGAFTIKSGFMDEKVLSVSEIDALATLPSKEGLLQMLLSVLTSGPRGLAVALNAIAEKDSEEGVA